jgi:hypothetical protein
MQFRSQTHFFQVLPSCEVVLGFPFDIQNCAKYVVHNIFLYMHDIKIVLQYIVLPVPQPEENVFLFPHNIISVADVPFFRFFHFFLPAFSSPINNPSNCLRISSPHCTSRADSSSSVLSNVLLFSRHKCSMGKYLLCPTYQNFLPCFNHIDLIDYIHQGHAFAP